MEALILHWMGASYRSLSIDQGSRPGWHELMEHSKIQGCAKQYASASGGGRDDHPLEILRAGSI
jgi:hypothetical protein